MPVILDIQRSTNRRIIDQVDPAIEAKKNKKNKKSKKE
jgi:hypothetical protein